MQNGVVLLLTFAYWVFIARALISWLPIRPGSTFYPIVDGLHQVTEPVLGPIRRVMPRTGMFDLSIIVVVFGINLVLIPLAKAVIPA